MLAWSRDQGVMRARVTVLTFVSTDFIPSFSVPKKTCATQSRMLNAGAHAKAERGEQGDPLMPLFFSIAIHATLDEVAAHLEYFWTMCT